MMRILNSTGGRYQELPLTNRQYAFARFHQGHAVITAVNNDGADVSVAIPSPVSGTTAVNLLDGEEYPVTDQKITVTLPANRGGYSKDYGGLNLWQEAKRKLGQDLSRK